jgi:hypothetical protein
VATLTLTQLLFLDINTFLVFLFKRRLDSFCRDMAKCSDWAQLSRFFYPKAGAETNLRNILFSIEDELLITL